MADAPDLAAYLRARLDDREAAIEFPRFDDDPDSVRGPGWGTVRCAVCGDEGWGGYESIVVEAWYEHAEKYHQRTWALADIAANRAVLDLHAQIPCVNCEDAGRGTGTSCRTCHHGGDGDPDRYDGTCETTRAFAQPYATRPDFHAEWSGRG